VCLLTNIRDPPREGNYRDEHGNAIKPAIVADCDRHMRNVNNADRMANSYTASRRILKWTKKFFFYMLDLAIVNSYILLSSSFTNLSRLVLEIFKFLEKHAQNLNTWQNNSASWDLQMGFNTVC